MPTKYKKSEAEESELEVGELADSLEALLKSYSDDAQDGLEEAQKNAQQLLKKARAPLKGDDGETCCAGNWIRENPLPAAGISAAVGVVFGILLAKR